MRKEDALDKFNPLRSNDTIHNFIEWLYEKGYVILALEEQWETKVTWEFIGKWVDRLSNSAIAWKSGQIDINDEDLIKMLEELGIKVEEEEK